MEKDPAAAAKLMEKVADRAARVAHEALFEAINEETALNDHQKIGAFLTAATYAYRNALEHARRMGEAQAVVMVGMFKTLCSEQLAELMDKAGDKAN